MLQFEEQKQKLNEYRDGMKELKDALSYDETLSKITELEATAAKDGFWDDLDNSQKVLKETSRLKDIVQKYDALSNEYNDLFDLIDMADEEEDLSMLDDVLSGVENFIKTFEDMGRSEISAHDKLKEFVGHTPIQVMAGSLLGIVNACVMHFWVLP